MLLAAAVCVGGWIVLREAATEIRKARSRSEFVAGVSHDLRTPVASMKMLAETLYLGRVAETEKQRKFAGTIVQECDRLSHLIERVLFFVRFGQDALVYSRREVDPGELVRWSVKAFLSRFEGPSVGTGPDVSVDTAPGLPDVRADESAMSQVILNLLDNAQKYSPGERRPRIDVAVNTVGGNHWIPGKRREWVCITVRDYGIGMDRETLTRIFRRFYRGSSAVEDNISGVGLGLALCRHVIRAHGGRIDVESVPGEGSTFRVLLPAVTPGR